jgi:hypothetical protein
MTSQFARRAEGRVDRDRGIDQVAAQSPQPREEAILVGPRKARIADDVQAKDRREFPGLADWPEVRGFDIRQPDESNARSGSAAVDVSQLSPWARRRSFESNSLLSHRALRRREARDLHRVTMEAWKISRARRDP